MKLPNFAPLNVRTLICALLPLSLWAMLFLSLQSGNIRQIALLGLDYTFLQGFRAAFPLIAGFVAVVVLVTRIPRERPGRFLFLGPLGLLAVYGLVGVIASTNSPQGFDALYWSVSYLSVPLILWAIVWKPDQVEWSERVVLFNWAIVIFGMAALFAFGLIYLNFGSFIFSPGNWLDCRAQPWFDTTSHYIRDTGVGRYAALTGIISLSRLWNPSLRSLWLMLFLASMILLLYSGARTSMVGFMVAAPFVILITGGKRAAIGFVIAGVVLTPVFWSTGVHNKFLDNCIFRDATSPPSSSPIATVEDNPSIVPSISSLTSHTDNPVTNPDSKPVASPDTKPVTNPNSSHADSPVINPGASHADSPVINPGASHADSPVISPNPSHSDSPVISPNPNHSDSPVSSPNPSHSDNPVSSLNPSHSDNPVSSLNSGRADSQVISPTASHADSPAISQAAGHGGNQVINSDTKPVASPDTKPVTNPNPSHSDNPVSSLNSGRADSQVISPGANHTDSPVISPGANHADSPVISPNPSHSDSPVSASDLLSNETQSKTELVASSNENTPEDRFKIPIYGSIPKKFFTFSGRTQVWEESLDLFRQSPFLGYGFQADRYLLNTHAHNSVVQSLLQTGLVGTIPFIAGLFIAWALLLRANLNLFLFSPDQKSLFIQVSGMLAFLSVRSFTESTGAFFGVDWLLLGPILIYLQVINYKLSLNQKHVSIISGFRRLVPRSPSTNPTSK